jgi:hypothetical protein
LLHEASQARSLVLLRVPPMYVSGGATPLRGQITCAVRYCSRRSYRSGPVPRL